MTHIPDEAVRAALEYYSEGGCMGLDSYERKEVATAMIEAALPYLQPVGVAAVRKQAFEEGFENGVEQSLNALDAYDDITRNEAEQGIRKLKPDYRALSPAEPVDQWQDIATAPKDGEPILIWKPDEHRVGEYLMSAYWCDDREGFVPVGGIHKQGYYSDTAQCNQGYPTHWMPLPAAPTSKGGD